MGEVKDERLVEQIRVCNCLMQKSQGFTSHYNFKQVLVHETFSLKTLRPKEKQIVTCSFYF